MFKHVHTFTRSCFRSHKHKHMHTHTYIHTCTSTYIRTYTYTCKYSSIHSFIHTYIHTYMNGYSEKTPLCGIVFACGLVKLGDLLLVAGSFMLLVTAAAPLLLHLFYYLCSLFLSLLFPACCRGGRLTELYIHYVSAVCYHV
jgi:hypothetical protein